MASILFDKWMIYDLDNDITEAKTNAYHIVRGIIPDIRLHSRQSVCESLKKRFGITLPDAKISTLNDYIATNGLTADSYAGEVLFGILEYLKQHYTQKNYTSCVIKHSIETERGLLMPLELIDGIYWQPNKQKLFHAPQIWGCVIETDPPELNRDLALKQHKGE